MFTGIIQEVGVLIKKVTDKQKTRLDFKVKPGFFNGCEIGGQHCGGGNLPHSYSKN